MKKGLVGFLLLSAWCFSTEISLSNTSDKGGKELTVYYVGTADGILHEFAKKRPYEELFTVYPAGSRSIKNVNNNQSLIIIFNSATEFKYKTLILKKGNWSTAKVSIKFPAPGKGNILTNITGIAKSGVYFSQGDAESLNDAILTAQAAALTFDQFVSLEKSCN